MPWKTWSDYCISGRMLLDWIIRKWWWLCEILQWKSHLVSVLAKSLQFNTILQNINHQLKTKSSYWNCREKYHGLVMKYNYIVTCNRKAFVLFFVTFALHIIDSYWMFTLSTSSKHMFTLPNIILLPIWFMI